MSNCEAFSAYIDPVDRECLDFLQEIELVFDKEDVRNFDVKFVSCFLSSSFASSIFFIPTSGSDNILKVQYLTRSNEQQL